ncbi:MAG: Sua5/YciO/YrdC/YwlC family protein [Woeseiaceae bacterium]|nr:Sua5/YciO/YrdC/YwlC family protein [Woeseiaceae bacterium]
MSSADKAVAILHGGGVIAYPTEGVFGLGCLPDHLSAVQRVLEIKQRDASKGLILIAADTAQLDGWIQLPADTKLPEPDPEKPITWVVPTASKVKAIVRGDNVGIAVRLTTNPVARNICLAAESPIISTSANLSGKPAASDQLSLHRQFRSLVDYIVPGDCGPATGPSEIRHLATGAVLRPR